jgi:hypothetical protein
MANPFPETEYPRWSKTWKERLSEVDDQIVDYLRNAKEGTEDAVENITRKIDRWFDSQTLDTETRAEFDKLRADQKLLRAQIENRITHLVEDGKIKVARQMRGENG